MIWWENDFLKVRNNKLCLENQTAESITKRYGTPLYIYSRKQILKNVEELRRVFKSESGDFEIRIAYAMKANPHHGILKTLLEQGLWIDAVSPAEVELAMKTGFPAERIIFTGTSISQEDFERVLKTPGVIINIDALEQIELLAAARQQLTANVPVKVSVRWNPGLGRGFCSKTVTAGKRSPDGTPIKFGVEDSKVFETFKKLRVLKFLPVGLHQHLGSGWVEEDLAVVRKAVNRMIERARKLQEAHFSLEFLDFGGGFGPQYNQRQRLFPLEKYATHILEKIEASGLNLKAIILEPGKYLVANAGVLLMKVEYVKKSYGHHFACVNAGTYNSVPRPAIYEEAFHEIINANRVTGAQKTRITVAGHLCETADVFGTERSMPCPERAQILAVLLAGAYCRSMASNFNLREIPAEILL